MLKDHKENFKSTLPCRLINPAKSEMGIVSKKILDNITSKVRLQTAVNQWKNSTSVIEWFKGLGKKSKHTFVCFGIIEFYPSISEDLLKAALDFTKQHTTIPQQDTKIIFHSRKSLLFDKDKPWIKRGGNSLFDMMMGSYDGADVCRQNKKGYNQDLQRDWPQNHHKSQPKSCKISRHHPKPEQWKVLSL